MTAPQDLPSPTRKTPMPYVTILGATVGLLLPIAAIALMYWTTHSTSSETELSAQQKLRELQATEERQMTTYDWVEKPSKDRPGVARIPVARARELVLNEILARQKESKR
jgi:hypothetical protein